MSTDMIASVRGILMVTFVPCPCAECTVMLYDGSPFHPDGNVLFDFAQRERMTHFGTSAKYLDGIAKALTRDSLKQRAPDLWRYRELLPVRRAADIVSLGEVTRWLAEQAEGLGVEIFPGFAAAEVLYDEKGAVKGVATGHMGVGKDGEPTDNFQLGMELHAKYTVFAEGARGHLGKQLIAKYQLDAGRDQGLAEFDQAGLVGNGQKGTGDAAGSLGHGARSCVVRKAVPRRAADQFRASRWCSIQGRQSRGTRPR